MSRKIDLTGQKFGRLTVLHEDGRIRKEAAWLCECECGNHCRVAGYSLRSKHTLSCGCYMQDASKKVNAKHGLCYTHIYKTYYNIRTRCYNPKYEFAKNYSCKGIEMCPEWLGEHGFESFYEWSIRNGYKDGLTIDRKDNSKGYSPDNCRWVDMITQQNNRTNNRRIKIGPYTHTIAEWARILDINYAALEKHVRQGDYLEYVGRIKGASS